MRQLNSTGIVLSYLQGAGWGAKVQFSSWEHGVPTNIEGEIGPRYVGELATVIDLAKEAAETIGVVFSDPQIYHPEGPDTKGMGLPPNSKELVIEQTERLGWTGPEWMLHRHSA